MVKDAANWFSKQPVGVRAALIGAVTALVIFAVGFVWRPPPPPQPPDAAERAILLIDIGYSIYAFGLGIKVLGVDTRQLNRKLQKTYDRIRLKMPDEPIGPALLEQTRESLVAERDRECLDLGVKLGAVYTAGRVLVAHKGKPVAADAQRQLKELRHGIRLHLRALNVLQEIEANPETQRLFARVTSDSEQDYEELSETLKSSIAGEIRRKYAGKAGGDI